MTDTAQVQLEGWLPGNEQNGLKPHADRLLAAFTKAYDLGEDTTSATMTVVVGLVEVTAVKRRKHPEEKPPIAAVRFIRLEVVDADTDDATTVRAILDDLYAQRTGNDPLPLDEQGPDDGEDDQAGDVGGQPTS